MPHRLTRGFFIVKRQINNKEMAQTNKTTEPKVRKVRGTGIYLGDEFTFKPTEEGSPSQLNVKTCRGGKTFETTSETKPQRVAHLSCAADSPDPWTEYTDKLRQLGIKPLSEQKLSQKQRLVNEGGMQVYLNVQQGHLTYQGSIDLTRSLNWQSELMRQLQVIVRTLPVNEKFTKVVNKLKKGGLSHV